MKIYVIAGKIEGEETPWILNAWDEWSIDANPSGWEDAIEECKKKSATAEVRVGIVNVPDDFLFQMFAPVEVNATKASPYPNSTKGEGQ